MLSRGYRHEPDESLVRVKEDRVIRGDGWETIDFAYLQAQLRMKETAMLRFSKMLRCRQNIQRASLCSIRRALIEQGGRLLGSDTESSSSSTE